MTQERHLPTETLGMNAKLEIARLSVQMTIAIMSNNGLKQNLASEVGIRSGETTPLVLFDKIFEHIQQTVRNNGSREETTSQP